MDVRMPDGTVIRGIPEGTTKEQVMAKYRQMSRPDPFPGDDLLSDDAMSRLASGARSTVTPTAPPSPLKGIKKYAQGVNEAAGALNAARPSGGLGTLEALGTLATGGIAAPILGTAESIALGTDPEESFARYTYQPRTQSGQAQLGLLGALASPLSDSGADAALLPMAAGSHAISSVRRAPSVKPAVPTREALKEAASAAYRAADEAGVVYRPEAVAKIHGSVESMLQRNGFDKDLHPDTAAVLRRLREQSEQGQPLSLEQMENLRRVALNAEGAMKPSDRRLAAMVVDQIDDITESLGAADTLAGSGEHAQTLLRQARDLHTRTKKSDEIDALIRRAELSAPNFSGSGMENALRTEFRALAKNDKRMRRFSPEERAAIERVAQGDLPTNTLRMLGKFAPTGVVSTGLSSGAGYMVGGPVGAMALPLTGFVARRGATALTERSARRAGEMMRGGEIEPLPAAPAAAQSVVEPMVGELTPRHTLALPAPDIIAGSRSAPGTAFAREQMGMTPDIERAGALHPSTARESLVPRPSSTPALPSRPAPGLLSDQRPMVVDSQGRVARIREEIQQYLRDTGQDRMRNVRQPEVGPIPQRPGLLADEPPPTVQGLLGGSTRSVAEIEADIRRLDGKIQRLPVDEPLDSPRSRALEAEWARLRAELDAAEPRA